MTVQTRQRKRKWTLAPLALCVPLAFGSALSVPAVAAEQTPDSVEVRNRATVTKGFEAWRDGTGSPYDLLDENADWTIVGASLVARTYTGREDFLSNVIRPFGARMASRFVPEIRNLYADGNTVIVHFDAEGTARDGQPYRNSYAWFLTLRNDRIIKATAFFDSIAFNDFWQRVTPTQ
ncbi:nuclear transport factor 2 family protein [Azospirillum sp. Marseille-Q6669]